MTYSLPTTITSFPFLAYEAAHGLSPLSIASPRAANLTPPHDYTLTDDQGIDELTHAVYSAHVNDLDLLRERYTRIHDNNEANKKMRESIQTYHTWLNQQLYLLKRVLQNPDDLIEDNEARSKARPSRQGHGAPRPISTPLDQVEKDLVFGQSEHIINNPNSATHLRDRLPETCTLSEDEYNHNTPVLRRKKGRVERHLLEEKRRLEASIFHAEKLERDCVAQIRQLIAQTGVMREKRERIVAILQGRIGDDEN